VDGSGKMSNNLSCKEKLKVNKKTLIQIKLEHHVEKEINDQLKCMR
jgi:hypothetical protein